MCQHYFLGKIKAIGIEKFNWLAMQGFWQLLSPFLPSSLISQHFPVVFSFPCLFASLEYSLSYIFQANFYLPKTYPRSPPPKWSHHHCRLSVLPLLASVPCPNVDLINYCILRYPSPSSHLFSFPPSLPTSVWDYQLLNRLETKSFEPYLQEQMWAVMVSYAKSWISFWILTDLVSVCFSLSWRM